MYPTKQISQTKINQYYNMMENWHL